MRILFISNLYPPFDLGGLEQRCQEVAELLRMRGHIVQILTSGPHKVESDHENQVVRSLFLQADLSYYRPLDFFLKRTGREIHNIQELRRVIDCFTPDVILIWGMWNLSRQLAFSAEEWLPGRVAYNIASYWPVEKDVHEEYWQSPARHLLTEWVKRPLRIVALNKLHQEGYRPELRFAHAFCASDYVRNALKHAGVLPESSQVIYPGIDPEPILGATAKDDSKRTDTLRLLYFGSLVPHKGVHTTIESMGLLEQRDLANGIELTILGSGHPEYEKQLQSLAHQLDVEANVRFIGKVPREDIPMWLKRFDVFLFTSIWPEPIAATVMEAMAAGLLVIGTEVGGQTEMLLHGQNSLTFKAGDSEALANHITHVASDPDMRLRLAEAGQRMVLERFTLKRMADEIEQYLFNIVSVYLSA